MNFELPADGSVNSKLKPEYSKLAVVALGSNLGDSARILREALAQLQALSDQPMLKSSLWQTSPVDCPPGSPPFVNAVVAFIPRAEATPEQLLRQLQDLERQFGRPPKKVLNEPRPLDLDLVVFGTESRDTSELTLPHPRAHLRRFVLQPLCEIAPELILPGQTQTSSALLRRLPPGEAVTRLPRASGSAAPH